MRLQIGMAEDQRNCRMGNVRHDTLLHCHLCQAARGPVRDLLADTGRITTSQLFEADPLQRGKSSRDGPSAAHQTPPRFPALGNGGTDARSYGGLVRVSRSVLARLFPDHSEPAKVGHGGKLAFGWVPS